MKTQTKEKICNIHHDLVYSQPFAQWAKPKKNELKIPRTKYLGSDNEVIWDIAKDGNNVSDHIEMSGFYSSSIISYSNDKDGRLRIMKHFIVPTLRLEPNLTHSSFSHNFKNTDPVITANGRKICEYPQKISIKGNLKIKSDTQCKTTVTREFLPCVNQRALIEIITVKNNSDTAERYSVDAKKYSKITDKFWCIGGEITAGYSVLFTNKFELSADRQKDYRLKPNESFTFYCVYYACQNGMDEFNIDDEIRARRDFINEIFNSIKLETPINELNAQFSHCVLRGSESIFKTKNGLMHAPGGGNYYAALWTNDQCEYANPFFPFSGYKTGIEQSINCYSLYEKYMDKSNKPMKDKRALVTSIIAEGDGYWNGAGDRGDGEMYAYGLSRFLLEMSDENLIGRFWDNLVWCIDFALSRKTADGIIASDSDELENRFESGSANLFTSCITYDALANCIILADTVGDNEHKNQWTEEKENLKSAIEKYFGANVEGYDTYRYYDGNKDLRSWICMPLTVEIFDRADETVKALFSDRLYYDGMLRSTSANDTTWDRSLLFALRGTFLASKAEKVMTETINYCKNRLLGSHAPYPYEAYPEGNRAHLAAESILFARVVTEGLFGLRAVGLNMLRIRPQLSRQCPEMTLNNIKLFSKSFDITADENGITVTCDNNTYHTESFDTVFDFNNCSFV